MFLILGNKGIQGYNTGLYRDNGKEMETTIEGLGVTYSKLPVYLHL